MILILIISVFFAKEMRSALNKLTLKEETTRREFTIDGTTNNYLYKINHQIMLGGQYITINKQSFLSIKDAIRINDYLVVLLDDVIQCAKEGTSKWVPIRRKETKPKIEIQIFKVKNNNALKRLASTDESVHLNSEALSIETCVFQDKQCYMSIALKNKKAKIYQPMFCRLPDTTNNPTRNKSLINSSFFSKFSIPRPIYLFLISFIVGLSVWSIVPFLQKYGFLLQQT